MSEIKGCMNCGNISCGNNKKRESAGCGRWISPEDKIAELEKENERLTVDYETLKLHDEEEIGILKSENAELKEINEGYCRSRDRLISIGFPNFKDCKEYAEHLTKAKELLGYIVKYYREDEDLGLAKEINEAEQFLKEV